jgi:catechol 2,3-dioxygenase-like lactoylglutathione lyase family enzyme
MERAVAFYTQQLGFQLEARSGKAFACVTLGKLRLILGGRSSSAARPLPDGRAERPRGWNCISIYVADLRAEVIRLRQQGVRLRDDAGNDTESGPDGRHAQIEDPDGNPIELCESSASPKGSADG